MFKKQNLIETSKNLSNKQNELVGQMWEFIKDPSNTFDDKWEVYSNIPDNGKFNWVQHYEYDGLEIMWYDDHYIDRCVSVDNLVIVNRYLEKTTDTDPNIILLKKQMMDSGVRYWTNDW